MTKTLSFVLLLSFTLAAMPLSGRPKPKPESFIIDPSKDYVYFAFDHVGAREALTPQESTNGLWLRLVNNCRVPIIVATFNTGANDPVVGVISIGRCNTIRYKTAR